MNVRFWDRQMSGMAPEVGRQRSDGRPIAMAALALRALQSGQAAFVKSFGRREAYESLRGTNPRAADNGLWVFLFSAERGEVTTGSDLRWT